MLFGVEGGSWAKPTEGLTARNIAVRKMEIARLSAARQPNARRGEIRLVLTLNEYWLGRTARKSLALSLTKESRRPSNLPESVRLNRVRLQSSSKNPLLITRLVKGESWLKLSNSSERLRQINMFFLLRKMGAL